MDSLHANIQGWKANEVQTPRQPHFSSHEFTAASISKGIPQAHPQLSSPPLMASRSISSSLFPEEEDIKPRPLTAYTSASSERRAIRNRERDPSWVPRPPNPFIIFRSEFSQKHAQSNNPDGPPPPPEKTLSKRAAEAWGKLSFEEKKSYQDRADKEKKAHAEKYPGYTYRPRRRHSGPGKATGAPSRREQVESFMRRAAKRNQGDSESDYSVECSSPAGSMGGSSSPEPYDAFPHARIPSDSRSKSLPRYTTQHIGLGLDPRTRASLFSGSTPSLFSPGEVPLFKPRSLPDEFDFAYPTPPGSQYASSGSDDGLSVHSYMDSPVSVGLDADMTHSMSLNDPVILPVSTN